MRHHIMKLAKHNSGTVIRSKAISSIPTQLVAVDCKPSLLSSQSKPVQKPQQPIPAKKPF